MSRLLIGLILGVLISAGGAYGAVKLVSNPMTSNLDGGGYAITNVHELDSTGEVTAQANIETAGSFVGGGLATWGQVVLEPADTSVISISAGAAVPTATANPGSVYIRGGLAVPAQLWQMTPTGWACETGCTP